MSIRLLPYLSLVFRGRKTRVEDVDAPRNLCLLADCDDAIQRVIFSDAAASLNRGRCSPIRVPRMSERRL